MCTTEFSSGSRSALQAGPGSHPCQFEGMLTGNSPALSKTHVVTSRGRGQSGALPHPGGTHTPPPSPLPNAFNCLGVLAGPCNLTYKSAYSQWGTPEGPGAPAPPAPSAAARAASGGGPSPPSQGRGRAGGSEGTPRKSADSAPAKGGTSQVSTVLLQGRCATGIWSKVFHGRAGQLGAKGSGFYSQGSPGTGRGAGHCFQILQLSSRFASIPSPH